MRALSQTCDGLFQASLVASVVFASEATDTAAGFFRATLLVAMPFTIIGPFAGVFIDRWSRRKILRLGPLVKAALALLVLADPDSAPLLFYTGALLVLSVNRFFLSAAQAVVPRLVPARDLLPANSYLAVGGTVALLAGVFAGGKIVDATDSSLSVVLPAALGWLGSSAIASRIRSDLRPHQAPGRQPDALLGHQIRLVVAELADGARRLWRTPRALGPITSIVVDQIGQGLVLTLALVAVRRADQGVGAFSDVVGAGGVGVLAGVLTVRFLRDRFRRETIVAGAFLIGGVAVLALSIRPEGWPILAGSAAIGLTFAWKKSAVDTMVQESLPDGYRGRVASLYDIWYNLARVIAGALSIGMVAALGLRGSLLVVGIVYAAWTPVLPLWVRRVPEIRIRFAEGARAEEWPRTIIWGGVEEPVEVVRSGLVEREGRRLRAFRLSLADGSVIEVEQAEPSGEWTLVREAED